MPKRDFQLAEYIAEHAADDLKQAEPAPAAWGVEWHEPGRFSREPGAIGTFTERKNAETYAEKIPGGGKVFPLWRELLTPEERKMLEDIVEECEIKRAAWAASHGEENRYTRVWTEKLRVWRGLLARAAAAA